MQKCGLNGTPDMTVPCPEDVRVEMVTAAAALWKMQYIYNTVQFFPELF